MTSFEILFFAGALAAAAIVIYFSIARQAVGSWLLAALLGAGFAGYSVVTIWAEGPLGFIANHSTSLWGVQVWYDLVFSIGIALFLILPRARAAGMRTVPWVIVTGLVASVALLPMIARMLYLEQMGAKAPA